MKDLAPSFQDTTENHPEHLPLSSPSHALKTPSHPHPQGLAELLERGSRHHGNSQQQDGQAFFAVDLGETTRRIRRWRELLPRVEPFYAVKCNSNPQILRSLVRQQIGFDCASKAEISSILKLGVAPSSIIFANPCKPEAHVRYALSNGVTLMTFDNEDELRKIARISRSDACSPAPPPPSPKPSADAYAAAAAEADAPRLVLRLLADDSRSACPFGVKFGAPGHVIPSLLLLARQLGLNVVGVSFHVGSGCFDALAFRDAVKLAHAVIQQAKGLGFHLELLDLGGGFPGVDGHDGAPFHVIAEELSHALEEYFPASSGVRIIAEPGRYVVASALTLAVCVQARRRVLPPPLDAGEVRGEPSFMYYLSDGVYGSLNCVIFDHAKPSPKVLRKASQFLLRSSSPPSPPSPLPPLYECSLWGPTCDSMDCISRKELLPELEVGDWLYFENMGAYTLAAATTFNGFPLASLYYFDSEKS